MDLVSPMLNENDHLDLAVNLEKPKMSKISKNDNIAKRWDIRKNRKTLIFQKSVKKFGKRLNIQKRREIRKNSKKLMFRKNVKTCGKTFCFSFVVVCGLDCLLVGVYNYCIRSPMFFFRKLQVFVLPLPM